MDGGVTDGLLQVKARFIVICEGSLTLSARVGLEAETICNKQ